MSLEATNLTFTVDGRAILLDVSLYVPSGSSVALVGPSGCGKTTLLNCLALIQQPTTGTVTIDGANATAWGGRRRSAFWRSQAAFIFQDYGLVEDEPVGFNVCMAKAPLWGSGRRGWGTAVNAALATVGLEPRVSEPVSRLSGGERQRVGIARAIHKDASLIFADEPTASLDAANRHLVQSLLLGQVRRGATAIIATHDLALAEACDAVVELPAA